MAVDNKQIATDVLELVGGAENVTVATNCMTRLRLTLKDNSKADVEKIKKVKGVLGCQFAGSQLQVIIGQNVPKVLAEFVAISGVKQGEAVDENLDAPKEKFELKNLPNIILDYLSGSMTQLIPLLMAGGLFRTIAAVLGPTMLGVLSADDPTYTFLYTTLYEATFTFIPIYLGYAAAKKLGASPVLGILIVMAVLGAFWQLFVVCGMHMPVILLAQVQIIAAGYDPFVFVSTNCAMAAVWGCAFGAFLKMKNPDEKSLAIGYVISAIAGGVTEPALFGILMRFRRTMFGMFIGGAIGAVFSGLMGVTYYLAGGASNFLVFTNYLQGGQMNTVWAIVGMAISFVIAAAVVFVSGFSKEELAEMEA